MHKVFTRIHRAFILQIAYWEYFRQHLTSFATFWSCKLGQSHPNIIRISLSEGYFRTFLSRCSPLFLEKHCSTLAKPAAIQMQTPWFPQNACPQLLRWKDITQLAFYVNLHRAVIGPSATLTGRWRPDIDLRRMLTGYMAKNYTLRLNTTHPGKFT